MNELYVRHRLNGLEPDNLLAFLALLGLLRALQTSRLEWRPRAGWDLNELRPAAMSLEEIFLQLTGGEPVPTDQTATKEQQR